jgi:hypothetical protein
VTEQANLSPHPGRRFRRLSVRGLIVLVMVIGGGTGWYIRSARLQREAVAAIEKVGGAVSYDWQWKSGKYSSRSAPWVPNWLVEHVGIDY